MAIDNNTKMANRYGLNIKFYQYADDGSFTAGAPLTTIDFANEVSIELTSELTWATGGQSHADRIAFKDPVKGTLKISTQVVNAALMKIAAGGGATEIADTNKVVSFANGAQAKQNFFIIVGETVWQGEDGTIYSETITAYKACVKPGYNATYNGSGEPQSLDVEFELGTNALGKVCDFLRDDQ